MFFSFIAKIVGNFPVQDTLRGKKVGVIGVEPRIGQKTGMAEKKMLYPTFKTNIGDDSIASIINIDIDNRCRQLIIPQRLT